MKRLHFFYIGLGIFSYSLFGVEKPVLPGMNEDTLLFEGKTANAFFSARLENPDCRSQLQKARTTLQKRETSYQKLLKEGAPDEELLRAKRNLDDAQYTWEIAVGECGFCTARNPEQTSSPKWIMADGSCWIDSRGLNGLNALDTDAILETFERAKTWLTRADHYPKRNHGFDHLLEFLSLSEAGKPLLDQSLFPKLAYLAVKGEAFGIYEVFTYVIENFLEERSSEDKQEFMIHFGKATPPAQFDPHTIEIKDTGIKGEPIVIAPEEIKELSDVQGMWYVKHSPVEKSLYFRYYTAAVFQNEFEPAVKFMAHKVLQSTLVQMVEKAFGQPQ